MIVLTVIAPSLIRFLRPYYSRRTIRPSLAEEGPCESQEPKLETSDRLDVHLAFASCVIVAAFLLCTAVSTTKLTLIVCTCLHIMILSVHLLTCMIQPPFSWDVALCIRLRSAA